MNIEMSMNSLNGTKSIVLEEITRDQYRFLQELKDHYNRNSILEFLNITILDNKFTKSEEYREASLRG